MTSWTNRAHFQQHTQERSNITSHIIILIANVNSFPNKVGKQKELTVHLTPPLTGTPGTHPGLLPAGNPHKPTWPYLHSTVEDFSLLHGMHGPDVPPERQFLFGQFE